jgi:lysyl-tRNA synthetase class 2
MSAPTDKERALARKEGAKKAQDVAGLSDMGGVNIFHVVLENAKGNWDLMEEAMSGANTPVDECAEERKGGAQGIAKAFLSAGDDRLCIYVHVPENLADTVNIHDWFDVLVKSAKATVVQQPKDGFAKAETLQKAEVFPLKLRDEAIGQGFAYLRSKQLVPQEEDSDDEKGSFEENYEW